jgi:hypothetical protein
MALRDCIQSALRVGVITATQAANCATSWMGSRQFKSRCAPGMGPRSSHVRDGNAAFCGRRLRAAGFDPARRMNLTRADLRSTRMNQRRYQAIESNRSHLATAPSAASLPVVRGRLNLRRPGREPHSTTLLNCFAHWRRTITQCETCTNTLVRRFLVGNCLTVIRFESEYKRREGQAARTGEEFGESGE